MGPALSKAGLLLVCAFVLTASSDPTAALASKPGSTGAGDAKATTAGTITEFILPTTESGPTGITTGPDGNLWLAQQLGSEIARITPAGVVTEFPITASGELLAPFGITVGPDGALWFTGTGRGSSAMPDWIGRITTAGAVTLLPLPDAAAAPDGITAGPDGNLWFTEYASKRIGQMTPQGVVTEFRTLMSHPVGMTAGPDGNLWFAEANGAIGRITTAGKITEYPTSPPTSPWGITAGPDGNLWFTDRSANAIGRITTAGSVVEFAIPTPNSNPQFITTGPDGNMWFTELSKNKIGRITPSGIFREWRTPTVPSEPVGIAPGPDGNLWFAEAADHTPLDDQVGRITDRAAPAETLDPSFGSPGVSVAVSGSGFGSFETVNLRFVDSVNGATTLGSVLTDGAGQFSAQVIVPSSATAGVQTIKANGKVSFLSAKQLFTVS